MELMSYLLTAFGHTPLMAFDGESGVRMAREQRPDLILCDVHLPCSMATAWSASSSATRCCARSRCWW